MAAKKKDTRNAARPKPKKAAPADKPEAAAPTEPQAENPPTPQRPLNDVPVVGFGASAGGLDAFKRFFAAMPAKSGIAFVLIPHLDPTHESMMVELLRRHTKMPVVEATEGLKVEADHVYVIPPNKYLSINDGVLNLTGPVRTTGFQTSIDPFLRSLADDKGERAICIIGSGTGSHGSLGLRAIKAAGGMAMVQDPSTAEQPRMPQNAVATGLADYVLPVDKMPEALVKYVQHYYVNGGEPEGPPGAPDHLNQLIALLRARAKFDFRCYRKKMLMRRVERRMGLNHIENVAGYVAHLRENPDEVKQLARDLLISVTSFFRDPEALELLAAEAIVPIIAARPSDGTIRVWVPGCATGEEVYTIAILFLEEMARAQILCHLQIFATDVDQDALETARQGIYPESISADVSAERLARFFTRMDESAFRINKQVREAVVFAPQNLLVDAPFSRLDLISCRNMLIYLEPEVQKKVISLFHFGLAPGGYLLLGPSETVGRQTDMFESVSKKWRIFRRIGASRGETVEFPIAAPAPGQPPARRGPEGRLPRERGVAELTQRLLLEELAPAAVLINAKHEILYFLGPTSRYLEMPTGEPTKDLLVLAREGLRSKLRGAVHRVMEHGQPVQIGDVQIRRDGEYVPVLVTVKPASRPTDRVDEAHPEGLCMVIFQDAAKAGAPARAEPAAPLSAGDAVVKQLEYELRATKEDLQGTIEEMESSNEELKASNEEIMSMNEELQSANEELETSKEEMQTLNEELATVNNQLQEKVQELEDVSNDMANLLNCTDFAIVFLDARLRIRRFTQPATRLLYLVDTDIGRPINEIRLKFADADLLADAEAVIRKLTPREKQVQTEDGRWHARRITLFRTTENRIDGVVLSFVDVTELKEAAVKAQLLATILFNSSDAISVFDLMGRITHWNEAAEKLYGYGAAEALKLEIAQLVPEGLRKDFAALCAALQAGERAKAVETRRIAKDGRVVEVWSTATVLTDDTGRPVAISEVDRDITELTRRRAELEKEVQRKTALVRESEARLRAILNAPDDGIITIDQHGLIDSVNPAATRMFGYGADEMIGKSVDTLVSAAFRGRHRDFPKKHHETGAAPIVGMPREIEARRKDGTTFPVEWSVGEIEGLGLFTGIIRDISRRKQLEREVVNIATLEQQRIGQDLHDECGQELTALGLLFNGLAQQLERPSPEVSELTRKIADGLARVLRRIRGIAQGLAVAEIKGPELHGALEELVARICSNTEIKCALEVDKRAVVEDDAEATQLYHIAQEACTNALKHSGAKNIAVRLQLTDNVLVLEICDDGRGMASEAGNGLGLRIMRNRAAVIGAGLSIRSAEPNGTIVSCALRMDRSHGSY